MPIKVLVKDKNELRLRFEGESHTSLQLFRSKLNDHKSVEYSNYFTGHPELDDPELYIRTKGKADPVKLVRSVCKELSEDFATTEIKG